MGTVAEKLIYLGETKSQLKDTINYATSDEITSSTTFRNYPRKLYKGFIEIINTRAEALFERLPKVLGSGSSVTLNNVEGCRMSIEPIGKSSQESTPTPDSPVEIKDVTGDNEVEVVNKNLFYYNKQDLSYLGVNFTFNSDKTVNVNGSASGNIYLKLGELFLPKDGTYYISGCPSNGSTSTYNITTYLHDEKGTYLDGYQDNGKGVSFSGNRGYRLDYYIHVANGATVSNKVFKPMVLNQNIETEYVEHKSQSYLLSLGNIHLRGIPNTDYKDSIVGSPDDWQIKRKIGYVVLDGSESWQLASSVVTGTSRFYYDDNTYLNNNDGNAVNVMSNKFKSMSWGDIYHDDTTTLNGVALWASNTYAGRLVIRIDNTYADTVANFKTWLSTHNTEVQYVLANPIYEPITSETLINQLNELYYAYSYEGQTNVFVTSSGEQMEVNLEAIKQYE